MLIPRIEIGGASQFERIIRYSPNVRPGIGVVGVDRVEEAFQGRCTQSLESKGFPPLSNEKRASDRAEQEGQVFHHAGIKSKKRT